MNGFGVPGNFQCKKCTAQWSPCVASPVRLRTGAFWGLLAWTSYSPGNFQCERQDAARPAQPRFAPLLIGATVLGCAVGLLAHFALPNGLRVQAQSHLCLHRHSGRMQVSKKHSTGTV